MPPDITAGLMALAEPPGAASVGKPAEPPAFSAASAAVFALLLTQSSPPSLKLAAPKTDAVPTVKLGFAAKQQISKNPKTLGMLKTMDTLPPLSFPAMGTVKAKASELLLPSPTGHKIGAEDKSDAGASQNTVDLMAAAANVLNAVPGVVPLAVPVQAVLVPVHAASLPVLTPAAAPTLVLASAIAAPSVSGIAAPLAASFKGTSPSPAKVSLPPLPAPNISFVQVGPAHAQGAPLTAPVPASLPPVALLLPQHPQTPSQALAPQLPQALAPQLPLPVGVLPVAGQTAQETLMPAAPASAASVPEAAITTAALPQLPPRTAALGPVALSREVSVSPQAAPLRLPLAPGPTVPVAPLPIIPTATIPITLIQQTAVAVPAGVPGLLPPGPAKQPGKLVQTALKSPPANADTNTRIDAKPMEETVKTTKAVLPGKLPEPNPGSLSSVPEKTNGAKADAKAPVEALEAGTLEAGTLTAAQAAPPAAVPSSKPLSAAEQIKIVHQVADGVGAMPLPVKSSGPQQMSLQLHPKDWGSLQVSVSVTPGQETGAAKAVTAHIVAETPQVKAALQSQTGALHQALRASGLNLTHLTVSVKPAAETVKPAAQSASAGSSAGQGQTSTGSSQAQPEPTAAGGQSAGMQLGTSAGSSQHGQQGQPPTSTAASAQAEPEPEDALLVHLQNRPVSGRIDIHA